ncbi:MAG: hypothetical protein JWO68_767, partial [Actinomycetia bacterium]|nr:hypothetical protein [Actinomycetes bacterium]
MRGRRPSRVRQRLALVVLVPTLGLGAFGGFEALARSRETDRAQRVEERVTRASTLLRIKLLVTNETFSTGATETARALGVAPAALASIIGFDPEARVAADRLAVDRAVRPVADDPVVRAPYALLVETRADLAAGRADLGVVLNHHSTVQANLTDGASLALERADDSAGDVGSSTALRRSTEILRATVDSATAVGVQLDGLAKLLTPISGADRRGALEELRKGIALDGLSNDRLDHLTTGSLRRTWRSVRASRSDRELRGRLRAYSTLAPSEVPAVPLADLIGVFVQGMHSLDGHDDLFVAAAADTVTASRTLHQAAARDRQVALGSVVAVAVAALVLAGLISRSIAQPLQDLAARAQRVTNGDLGDGPPPTAGPREVLEVSTTIEELVDNLRVVESQVGALAAGALADPVLDVPVPGRLGLLLHDSMLRLSRSMAERELLAQRLEHDASHDPLTGLANRTSLLDAIRGAVADADGVVAVIKVDLDGFKPVNETHGHDTGDRLLRVTAERLQSDAGPGNLVARIGGDEFVLVVTGLRDPAEATCLAVRAVDHLADPVRVGAVVTQVRASAGVVIADGTLDAEVLVRNAGLAATAAKAT